MSKYSHILQAVSSEPWAILPSKLSTIQAFLMDAASGHEIDPETVKATMAAHRQHQQMAQRQGVAVLPLIGTIVPRGNLLLESSGAVSVQRFGAAFRAAVADDEIGHIVIDIDSPGGQVGGVAELFDEIYSARGTKPITAVANTLAASAAYWVAAAADEIVATPSAQLGSIGVFAVHEDWSEYYKKHGVQMSLVSAGKYKTEGNPYEPLGDEARAAMQEMVDAYYGQFTSAVAQGRQVAQQAVVEGFGQGRVVAAETAVTVGLADRVATVRQVVDEALAELSGGGLGFSAAATPIKNKRERRHNLLAIAQLASDDAQDGPTADLIEN